MAQIPKFISKSNVTPSIIQANIDPNTAAAPFREAERSTAQMTNLFQSELSAWDKTIKQKEAEKAAVQERNMKVQEGLYKAQTMADLKIETGRLYNETMQQATAQTDAPSVIDQNFQALADRAILNAPTDKSKIDLTKSLIGMRASLYNKASNEQLGITNQHNMNQLEGILGRYEAEAASNPSRALELAQDSGTIFKALGDLGIPARQVDDIQQTFTRNLNFHAAKAQIQLDPLEGARRAAEGGFTDLGPKAAASLQVFAKNEITANKKALKGQLDDTTQRLIRGMPIDEAAQMNIERARQYGMNEEANQISLLKEMDGKMAGMDINTIRNTQSQLELGLSRGGVDVSPAYADLMKKFVQGNIKAIEEDPLTYGENKASSQYAPLTPIEDFSSINPELVAQRQQRALQMESLLGVPSPALKRGEVDNLVNQLRDTDVATQTKILSNVQSLGDRTAIQVSKALEKENPALSIAVASAKSDPELMRSVILGYDKLKAGTSRGFTKDEWETAATKTYEGFLDEDPKVAGKYVEAAKAIAANNPSMDPSDALTRAANMITIDREGIFTGNYKTSAPVPGMSSSDFTSSLKDNLKSSGDWGKHGNGTPVSQGGMPINMDREDPTDFQFMADGAGMYNVTRGGRKLVKADGSLYKINLGNFMGK
jgi:hypothetical protein